MKVLTTLAGAALAALGTAAALALAGDGREDASTTTGSTTAAVSAPATTGTTTPSTRATQSTTSRSTTVRDVRGPCDEAEHADDPRCGATRAADDRGRSGGRGDRHRRGSNRGRG